ncbi:MAG: proline--tRNA ligase, partial [Chloroflexi bacterium]|nr:proline--tRNA ligase [Chloroflexota bacterium]
IGGKDSHEFLLATDTGEDTVITCPSCSYTANAEKAESTYPEVPSEPEQPLEEVSTPGIKTIAGLAEFLDIPESKTLKAVFYMSDGEPVFVTIRGDLDVNEVKLKNALQSHNLRLAEDDEVKAAGLVAGSASAIGLSGIKGVADVSVTSGNNFVVGANKPDTHFKGANYPRDFQADIVTDIALAQPGQLCPRCGHILESIEGIEVGHIFKLGTFFSEALGAEFLDSEGKQHPIMMGCYGIGVGRLLAAAVEQNHDEKGIVFPTPIAPYQAHLVGLNMSKQEVAEASDKLYQELEAAGIEVLYDDRDDAAAGVKFNDADLLGLPVRLVVSPRNLEAGVVEVKGRAESEAGSVPLDGVIEEVRRRLAAGGEE